MKLLILNQLGTPNSPSPKDVGIYLDEFLMDKNIISLPYALRLILVKIGIVPRRRYSSAKKYEKVWTEKGSPLAINTFALEKKIQSNLSSDWKVVSTMRYGSPSIKSVLQNENLSQYSEIVFLPLYPQFAQATVGSANEKFYEVLSELKFNNTSAVKVVDPFYDKAWYIRAQSDLIKSYMVQQPHLLFSFHGIPMSQEKKSKISYYEQCLKTSKLIADSLHLNDQQYSVSFQSRVGFAKWLEPSTELVAKQLAQSGVKNLKVACPSFVADCLETIEEIGMELKEIFIANGGESFELIPCLNDNSQFAEAIASSLVKP
jgi:protoporphyrin/coproporphyrin ferrochelatase